MKRNGNYLLKALKKRHCVECGVVVYSDFQAPKCLACIMKSKGGSKGK